MVNSKFTKFHWSISYISIVQSVWNFAQSMAVSLLCSVQNFQTIGQLKKYYKQPRFNEIWVLRWILERFASLSWLLSLCQSLCRPWRHNLFAGLRAIIMEGINQCHVSWRSLICYLKADVHFENKKCLLSNSCMKYLDKSQWAVLICLVLFWPLQKIKLNQLLCTSVYCRHNMNLFLFNKDITFKLWSTIKKKKFW